MQIPVNKDLRDYKVKEVGNFSLREAIYLACAAATAYGVYFLETMIFDGEAFLPSCMIPAAAILAFGFLKPKGMSFSTYLQTVFIEENLLPRTLNWESDFQIGFDEYVSIYGEEYEPDEKFIKDVYDMYDTGKKGKNNEKSKRKSKKGH